MNKVRFSLFIAGITFPATLLLLSCPNPIDSTLARKVEDTIPPAITILTPPSDQMYFYGASIDVAGTVVDYADRSGGAPGAVQSLSYEEMYDKRIHGDIPVASDGGFSFSIDAYVPEVLHGNLIIVVKAADWNGNASERIVLAYDRTTGPVVVVYDHGPDDFNYYTSSSAAAVTLVIRGVVEIPTFYLRYDVISETGPDILDRNIAYDAEGGFGFDFTPSAEGVSGELEFILRAADVEKESTSRFYLHDDPVAPRLVSGSVAADNSGASLEFSEGIYHAGGADPILSDFSLAYSGMPASLTGLSGTPAGGDTSIGLGISVSGQPSGAETITITASNLADRVGNPIALAYDSLVLSLKDKTAPEVLQISSTSAGGAFRAGETVPITVRFSEPVTVSPPLALALNVGATAAYASGSGGQEIVLHYLVQEGDNVDPLNYTSAGALSGTVADAEGNPAVLTLPDPLSAGSLAAQDLRIDTSAPPAPAVLIQDSGDELILKAENLAGVPFTVTGEDGAAYALSLLNCTLIAGSASGTLPAAGFLLRASATGTVTVSATLTDDAGNLSAPGSDTSQANLVAPNPPVVTGSSPTNDTTPLWSWSTGGGGNGNYRYNLNSNDLGTATPTTLAYYAPSSGLGEGGHTLYVWERNDIGNWSESGSRTLTIDVTRPDSPTVQIADADGWINIAENQAGVPFTVTGESGATYAVSIDNGELLSGSAAGSLPAAGFVLRASSEGTVTVSVSLTDPAGNGSLAPGTATSDADLSEPGLPSVWTTETDPTTERQPTWNWSSGSGGAGVFRYRRDNSDLSAQPETSDTSFRPGSNLSYATHTLYVQERDAAGNWSDTASEDITIEAP